MGWLVSWRAVRASVGAPRGFFTPGGGARHAPGPGFGGGRTSGPWGACRVTLPCPQVVCLTRPRQCMAAIPRTALEPCPPAAPCPAPLSGAPGPSCRVRRTQGSTQPKPQGRGVIAEGHEDSQGSSTTRVFQSPRHAPGVSASCRRRRPPLR